MKIGSKDNEKQNEKQIGSKDNEKQIGEAVKT